MIRPASAAFSSGVVGPVGTSGSEKTRARKISSSVGQVEKAGD